MIIVSNRIAVNPERTQEFEERFKNRASQVDEREGFIAFQLLRPTQPDDPYIVITMWQSQAHFDAWKNNPSFKDGHKGGKTLPEDTVLGRPKLEVHEVISSTLNITTQSESA